MRQFLLLLLLIPGARAEDLDDARDNFETAVRSYVGTKSDNDGNWVSHLKGKIIRLKLTEIERDTVHRSGGRWRGLVDFEDIKSKKKFSADVTADTSSDLFDVKTFQWLSARERTAARAEALESAKTAGKPRAPGPAGLLPELNLPTLGGREAFLPECKKSKCLTVVVAPWCPHCRAETGVLVALKDYLPAHDVGMRVIVSASDEDKVNDYAKHFGPDTLVDPESHFRVPGFPCFIVSTNGGAILSQGGSAPENEKDPAAFASAIGLP